MQPTLHGSKQWRPQEAAVQTQEERIKEESEGVFFFFTERKLLAVLGAFSRQEPNQRHPSVDHAISRPAPCLMGETP